jgi:zinc/manganese transport system permease protein
MEYLSFFIEPFEYLFMKRALASCICISLGAAPVGIFLILRRMSLMGDALSHAILPGAAVGYLSVGLSLIAMGVGGLISGFIVAVISGLVTRYTSLKEDASFAGFFLISMALGVLLISVKHSAIDLMHILFGNVLAVNQSALLFIGCITTLTLLILTIIYRPFIIECFDPQYFRQTKSRGNIYHLLFVVIVVLNLVSGFQTMGTLLSLGIMMLPALSARFWMSSIHKVILLSVGVAIASSVIGLLIASYGDLPSGPAIVLTAGGFYIFSLIFGKMGGILTRVQKRDH